METSITDSNQKTFYFCTGVKMTTNTYLAKGDVWSSNGVRMIPFICANVPDNATFKFATDYNDLPESKKENILVTEKLGGNLLSKYAYFILN